MRHLVREHTFPFKEEGINDCELSRYPQLLANFNFEVAELDVMNSTSGPQQKPCNILNHLILSKPLAEPEFQKSQLSRIDGLCSSLRVLTLLPFVRADSILCSLCIFILFQCHSVSLSSSMLQTIHVCVTLCFLKEEPSEADFQQC